jgi:hypothetical protein
MRVRILALACAGLCAPGVALAQGSTSSGTMTTTPGVSCSGSGATTDCTINQTNEDTDTLGTGGMTGSGPLGDTNPGATGGALGGGSGIDSGSGAAGTLNNTTPGTSSGGSTGTTGTTGASGTLQPTTPGSSLGTGGASGNSSGGSLGGSSSGGSLGGSSSGGGL